VNPAPASHPEQIIRELADGGFVITPREGLAIRAVPDERGLRIDAAPPLDGCRLERGHGAEARFLLLAGDGGTELGRSAALPGAAHAGGERNLVMEDGRIYRLLLCGPADARFELLGWETPGAYLAARCDSRGWKVTPQPASSGLREIRPLLVLLAAELLEAAAEGRRESWGPRPGGAWSGPGAGPQAER